MAGLALTAALNLTGIMNWMVRQTTDLEVQMNSVERLVEYAALGEEAPAVIEGARPPPGWPSAGAIEAVDLVVRCAPVWFLALLGSLLPLSSVFDSQPPRCGRAFARALPRPSLIACTARSQPLHPQYPFQNTL